jgi:hypothetical protein
MVERIALISWRVIGALASLASPLTLALTLTTPQLDPMLKAEFGPQSLNLIHQGHHQLDPGQV